MRLLWNKINDSNINKSWKAGTFLTILILVNALLGLGIWLAFGRLFLPGILWMLCFIGYPAMFIGYFGGMLYLYNHEVS